MVYLSFNPLLDGGRVGGASGEEFGVTYNDFIFEFLKVGEGG